MFLYPVYTAIKSRLSTAELPAQKFLFNGQYLIGKDNTNYVIPAIYIELPKQVPVKHWPKQRLASAKDVVFKIHYISYAPFKNADNAQQEAAIQQHENILKEIDKLMMLWGVKDGAENVTEQFICTGGTMLTFLSMAVVSVLEYKTEVYSRHLA